jgi:hypothetical protein
VTRPAFVLALAVVALAAPRVTISVRPTVLFEGGAIKLTCRVPQDATNRALEWGLEGYRYSRVELDGADARVTHEWIIERVPCDVGPVFCRVMPGGDLAVQEIQVACHPSQSQPGG